MYHPLLLKNNFNLIRLIAATQVAVVHSCNHFGMDSPILSFLKLFPGVPLFFFVSGYLIGNTYIKNYDKGLAYFFRNRVLRLYPALIFCVVLSVLSVYLAGYFRTAGIDFKHFFSWIIGQMTIAQVYNPDFMRAYGTGVLNGSLWTITVEVQFYLLTPVLFFLFKNYKPIFIILFILSLLLNLYATWYLDWNIFAMKLLGVSFLPWVYMFMLGFLVNYYPILKFVKRFNTAIFLLAFIASMFLIGNYKINSMNSINPISVVLLALLVLKISDSKIYLPGFFANFVDRNDLSYGVYIYHMPIINLLLFLNIWVTPINIGIAIVFSFLLAAISWRFIEKPFLRMKQRPVAAVTIFK
jgi:peptidoglycan/LPS O-acetylase OafA/YrhL